MKGTEILLSQSRRIRRLSTANETLEDYILRG